MVYILLRNDDLCALSNYEHERRILEMFERYSIPQGIAVTPHVVDDPHDDRLNSYHPLHENPLIFGLLKEYQQRGLIEIAQHGYTHQTNVHRPSLTYTITESEYYQGIDKKWLPYRPAVMDEYSEFNGLSLSDQREKVIKGQTYLEKLFGIKLKSFIFPWNSLNKQCLEILRERGFQTVLCENNQCRTGGIYTVGCCIWDPGTYLYYIKQALHDDREALIQLTYHSWEMDEPAMKSLNETLRFICHNKDVRCLMPGQVPQVIPQLKNILPSCARGEHLTAELNRYVKTKITDKQYYVLNRLYYIKHEMKLWLVLFIMKYGGIPKMLTGGYLAFGTVVTASLLRYGHAGSFNLASFFGIIFFGGFLCGVLLLREREKWGSC